MLNKYTSNRQVQSQLAKLKSGASKRNRSELLTTFYYGLSAILVVGFILFDLMLVRTNEVYCWLTF
ncbi:hypothetical protein EXU30_14430 [Shewanella maritima]|uniref:Uncharacterized protein n=1 Tax=Shewanella maritima TaxID=2520507 RepID=A0A411PJL2_9GAMM|nr:hypothetical protein [Shewanella maritima]QBF83756.1 hypothetical protein EXU30_14430 [Shewanella maritima]